MSSYIYYKFKSQKTEQKIAFDGTGITVFDLKKEIILSNNFGKASELDLLLFDSSEKGALTGDDLPLRRSGSYLPSEYTDDTQIIPRSTSVIAKRMPASKPGKGNAALYVSGVSGPSARSDVKAASSTSGAPSTWSKFTAGANSKRFDGKEEKHRSSTAAKDNVSIRGTVHCCFSDHCEGRTRGTCHDRGC
jgi:protein MPE1